MVGNPDKCLELAKIHSVTLSKKEMRSITRNQLHDEKRTPILDAYRESIGTPPS